MGSTGKLIQIKDWKRGTTVPAPKLPASPAEEGVRKDPKYPVPEQFKGRPEPIVSLIIQHVKTDPAIQQEIADMRGKNKCWNYAALARKVTKEDRVWGVMLVEAIESINALYHIINGGRCADGIVSYRALQRICEATMAEQGLKNG